MQKYFYFLRHATADIIRPNQLDIDRCLVEKGRLQARRVAAFMQRSGITPDQVFCSPYPRAAQTAAIVCKNAGLPAAEELHWLALETPVADALAGFTAQCLPLAGSCLLIGHEPDFSLLMSQLLGHSQPMLTVKKASLSSISLDTDHGLYQLEWLIPCKFM